VRAAGSEFVLACDMRFAAVSPRFSAQPNRHLASSPVEVGIQHLTRLMGRAERSRSCER